VTVLALNQNVEVNIALTRIYGRDAHVTDVDVAAITHATVRLHRSSRLGAASIFGIF